MEETVQKHIEQYLHIKNNIYLDPAKHFFCPVEQFSVKAKKQHKQIWCRYINAPTSSIAFEKDERDAPPTAGTGFAGPLDARW